MLISIKIKEAIPANFRKRAKRLVVKSFNALGLGNIASAFASYSQFNEQAVIRAYADKLKAVRYCVDIAAGDGLCQSNAYALYLAGWQGLAVEYDGERFADLKANYEEFAGVALSQSKVTPENVLGILAKYAVPKSFGVLNLDIDGYDHFVLEKILSSYRPSLLCAEINEKIPPPIRFTVKWDPGFAWTGGHFYGQSLSQLYALASAAGYDLVKLIYNNAIFVPKEINLWKSLTPEEAYREGYLDKPDRKERFPWDHDMEEALHLPPQKALEFIEERFREHKGKFTISLT